jgi:hypothetical protein
VVRAEQPVEFGPGGLVDLANVEVFYDGAQWRREAFDLHVLTG